MSDKIRVGLPAHGSPLILLLAGHLAVVSLRQLPRHLLGNSVLPLLGDPEAREWKLMSRE
jgi:hypothetical protein